LEVNVTLRSLPTEASALTQPIREDLKTVIVFDNGAVLRSTNNLPAGMTLILSNSNARDVVCRVMTGRSMPSVKGYVEIEFMEPVKDFWGIHQEGGPGAASAPSVAPSASKTLPQPPPAPPAHREVSAAPPVAPSPAPLPAIAPPPKPVSASLAGTPEYDEFPAPTGMYSSPGLRSEPKLEPPARPAFTASAPVAAEKSGPEYNHFEVANSTSVANWTPPESDPPAAKSVFESHGEKTTATSPAPAPTRDFMSKGLMAYEKPGASDGATAGRTPMILGIAALVLAGVCGVVFFMHRGSGPAPVANAALANPPAPTQPKADNRAPAPVQTANETAAPTPPNEIQPQAQPIAAAPVQPAAAVAPIPAAVVTNASTAETAASETRNARRQDKSVAAAKQPEAATPKRPMLSNLKISAPNAPTKNLDGGDGAAPVTEISSPEMPAGSTPAALLSSSGRTANPPAPPPSDPPPAPVKTVTEPKLISAIRPVYPAAARQSNIEGSVTVVIYIDPTGKVFNARALSGPVMLRAAAEESVKQWKYSPGTEDGKPAQSHVVVKVDFKIN
jgi:TonB family protein